MNCNTTHYRANSSSVPGDPTLARWEQAKPGSEPLWAFFYADQGRSALQSVDMMLRRAPDDAAIREAYVWIALQMRQYARLSAWVRERERTPAERDVFLTALNQFIGVQNNLDPALAAELFPADFELRDVQWQAAVTFAARGYLRDAITLGQRVLAGAVTQRSAYALELGHWHLLLGDAANARRLLRTALGEPGDSFDQPPYTALREYYGILTETERESFAAQFPRTLNRETGPIHCGIAMALLEALRGDEEASRRELAQLLELRAAPARNGDEGADSAPYRYWAFVLTGGTQLHLWKFNRLATFWWETAMNDRAAIRLQGEAAAAIPREIRLRLFARKLVEATPPEAEMLAAEFVRGAPLDASANLASLLESASFPGAAIPVYRALWHRDMQNQQFLRGLLGASRVSGDLEAGEEALREAVAGGPSGSNPALYREALGQLADRLETRGALGEAQILLETALAASPADPILLDRLAGVLERRHRFAEAEATRRRLFALDPKNPNARLGLASLLERGGHLREAIDLLEATRDPVPRPEIEARLFDLLLKNNELAKAGAALERLGRAPSFPNLAAGAAQLAQAGDRKTAWRVLHQAITQCKDPRQRFPLQVALLDLLEGPPGNAAIVERERRLLRVTAEEAVDCQPAYCEKVARQQGGDRVLSELWDDGEGMLAAGAQLFRMVLERRDHAAAETLAAALIAHSDAGDQTFAELKQRAADAQEADLALRFAEARCRRAPAEAMAHVELAEALHRAGKLDEAAAVLDRLALRRVITGDVAGQVGQAFLDLGEGERATPYLIDALRNDRHGRNYRLLMRCARLLQERGATKEARHLVRVAFRNPANRDFRELAVFLGETVSPEDLAKEARELHLSGDRLRGFWSAAIGYRCDKQQFDAALSLAMEHPDAVTDDHGVREQLRVAASAGDRLEATAKFFEEVLVQHAVAGVEIGRDLALLYFDWAQHETGALKGGAPSEHLRRALELAPDLFVAAERLSGLCLADGDAKSAKAVLDQFLQASRDPGERKKAELLLARLPGA